MTFTLFQQQFPTYRRSQSMPYIHETPLCVKHSLKPRVNLYIRHSLRTVPKLSCISKIEMSSNYTLDICFDIYLKRNIIDVYSCVGVVFKGGCNKMAKKKKCIKVYIIRLKVCVTQIYIYICICIQVCRGANRQGINCHGTYINYRYLLIYINSKKKKTKINLRHQHCKESYSTNKKPGVPLLVSCWNLAGIFILFSGNIFDQQNGTEPL